jgi:4-carboxymuconolactone decarboxylase
MTQSNRIPLPTPETMNADQLRVYEKIVSGPRKTLVGPLRAALHNPELADRWQQLGALLRFGTSLPARNSELAILVTARRWNSQIEWHIHAQAAAKAGIGADVLNAIRLGDVPEFDHPDDSLTYEFARQLQSTGTVASDVYDRAVARWQAPGVVELTALVGYYTMVSMTLNAHEIPMPDDAVPPLEVPQHNGIPTLSDLPAFPWVRS